MFTELFSVCILHIYIYICIFSIYICYIKYIFIGIFILHCYQHCRAQLILTARKTLTRIATEDNLSTIKLLPRAIAKEKVCKDLCGSFLFVCLFV